MGKYSDLLQSTTAKAKRFIFRFTEGKYSGGEFSVKENGEIKIGRDISSDVAIIDTKVSRNHARLWSEGGSTFIEDLGSTNGTTVNGQKAMPKQQIMLNAGDTIVIGDSTFIYIGDDAVKETPSATPPVQSLPPQQNKPAQQPQIQPQMQKKAQEPVVPKNPPPLQPETATKKITPLVLDDPGEFSLDDLPEIPDLLDEEKEIGSKANVGRVELKKTSPIQSAKTMHDAHIGSSDGTFAKTNPIDLIVMLVQNGSAGIITANITKPFKEKIEITLCDHALAACKATQSKNFSQEKILTRFFLAKDGDFHFVANNECRRMSKNTFLDDIMMEINSQHDLLTRYRKIINSNQLRINVPITGRLADLKKSELESLQFMINAQEVQMYLNMFPDNDDFILLAEIVKFIDLGILFGDNNEEIHSLPADDIVEL